MECFNALRLALFSLAQGDAVSLFLNGKGVEIGQLSTEKFNISEQLQQIVDNGGKVFACGTCLKLRQQTENAICPISTLQELYTIIREADKVLSF